MASDAGSPERAGRRGAYIVAGGFGLAGLTIRGQFGAPFVVVYALVAVIAVAGMLLAPRLVGHPLVGWLHTFVYFLAAMLVVCAWFGRWDGLGTFVVALVAAVLLTASLLLLRARRQRSQAS